MTDYVPVFKALGDEKRLRILLMLRVRPLCVCELCEALEIPLSTLSAHLKILKHAGVVEDIKEGRWVIYKLSEEKHLLTELFNILEADLKDKTQFHKDRAVISRITRELCSLKLRGKRVGA
jgi:ArsR family transcriptional regulator